MPTPPDVHLFLSQGGDVLPRWREAFPDAVGAALARPSGADGAVPVLLWLRLAYGVPCGEQVAQLPERFRTRPLVVLSDLPSDDEALEAFTAGARGYANTHAAPAALRSVADVVLQGGLWIGESLMQRLVRATSQVLRAPVPLAAPAFPAPAIATLPLTTAAVVVPPAPAPAWSMQLTERERQVALRVAHGESNKEVARALGVTERTVKAHIGAVLEKLHVRDRLQLSLVVNGRSQPPAH